MIPPVVDYAWLGEHPQAVLVDVRWYGDGRDPHQAYLAGHLPGAVRVDLDAVLADPPSVRLGRHPLPSPERFAAGLAQAGIGDGDVVVAYDDDSGVVAARLVWLLRVTGRDASLLDGGLRGWRGRRDTDDVVRAPARLSAMPWPAERLASIQDVAAHRAVLLDARPGERFRGEVEPLDARAGHVPGAVSVPVREHVDERGMLLAVPRLRERMAAVDRGWISSCGSGVTACHNLLVAEYLRLPPGRLWPGSWSQWAATDRPAQTGDGHAADG